MRYAILFRDTLPCGNGKVTVECWNDGELRVLVEEHDLKAPGGVYQDCEFLLPSGTDPSVAERCARKVFDVLQWWGKR